MLVKVFISSVTYALAAERSGLAAQLKVIPPYEPRRFEDFTAQGRSSREACLAGVEDCDVYVLLLGPRYGDPFPDTEKAPTEEEFELARRLGKPILAFVKTTDEPDEPRQAEFKARVQHYVNGYFRDAFADPLTLNLAVTAALNELPVATAELTWSTLPEPVVVSWRWQASMVKDPGQHGPVLDAYLVPVGAPSLRATQLQALPKQLARAGREASFFEESDAVDANSDATAAWAWVRDGNRHFGGYAERRDHTYRGLIAYRSGQITVFEALPTDAMGALVNQAELQRRLSRLYVLAESVLASPVATTVVSAGLAPLDRVFEGDPSRVGGRMEGTMRLTSGQGAATPAVSVVPRAAIVSHSGDVAAELAVELLSDLRALR